MRDFAIASVSAATVTTGLLMLMTALLADDSVPVVQAVVLPPKLTQVAVPPPPTPVQAIEAIEPITDPMALPTERPTTDASIERIRLAPTAPEGNGLAQPVAPGTDGLGLAGFGNGNDALIELVNVTPIYPARMLALGIEGYVDLRYDVNATGRAQNIEVTFSTHRGFEQAAIRGVERIRYQPRMIDGTAVPVRGVAKRFSFNIDE